MSFSIRESLKFGWGKALFFWKKWLIVGLIFILVSGLLRGMISLIPSYEYSFIFALWALLGIFSLIFNLWLTMWLFEIINDQPLESLTIKNKIAIFFKVIGQGVMLGLVTIIFAVPFFLAIYFSAPIYLFIIFGIVCYFILIFFNIKTIFSYFFLVENGGIISSITTSWKMTNGIFWKLLVWQILKAFLSILIVTIPAVLTADVFIYKKLVNDFKNVSTS